MAESAIGAIGAIGGGLLAKNSADKANKSAKHAAERQMAYEQQAIDYLKQQEEVPTQYREGALNRLGSVYGIESVTPEIDTNELIGSLGFDWAGSNALRLSPDFNNLLQDLQSGKYDKDTNINDLIDKIQGHDKYTTGQAGETWKQNLKGSPEIQTLLSDLLAGEKYGAKDYGGQQGLIDDARNSPLYGAIMGGQKEGEEAIMRNASMTGGLRSGNVQENLYDYNTQLSNQALLQSYDQQLQGLQGLANLPSNANAIASQYGNMGDSAYSGTLMKGQTRQAGTEGIMSGIMGGAKMGMSLFG